MLKVEFYGDASEVIRDIKLFLSLNPLAEKTDTAIPAPKLEQAAPAEASESPFEGEAKELRNYETASRKYGESEWDKTRRTKEQMATDKEIEELASALGIEIDKTVPADRLVMQLREKSADGGDDASANISASPEDRKDPEQEAKTGEIVDGTAYTRDDVRQKLGEFAEKYGMVTAQKEGPKLLGAAKLSEIPDTPEAFKTAIDNLTAAIEADING